MAVKIVTDSTCDITQAMAKELDITIVPLHFTFGEKTYADGVDLTNEEFYQKLQNSDQIPVTSQVTVGAFEEVFSEILKNGTYEEFYQKGQNSDDIPETSHVTVGDFEKVFNEILENDGDEIVGVFISSEMSGTYQSACIASENINPMRIHISHGFTTTMGLHLLVYQAIAMRDQGMNASEISERLNILAKRVRILAVVGNLKYLYKGGRLSAVGNMAGTLLGIKPIIRIDDSGIVELAGKERGMKSAFRSITGKACGELDPEMPVCFGHIDAEKSLDEFMTIFGEQMKISDFHKVFIGPVVGTHAGPGCVGISYFCRQSS